MMTPGLINLLDGVGWRPWSRRAVISVLALICGLLLALIIWLLWW
jgi:hypothetical protein